MAARSLPTTPTFAANSELTSTQLTALVTYQLFWSSPPCFRAEQHTAQAVTTSTNTQITCETTIHDSDSGLSVATPYSYVIPFAGIWNIGGGYGCTGNGTGVRIPLLYQNGTVINGCQPEYTPVSSSAVYEVAAMGLPCNVGDVIALYGYQTSGSTLNTTLGPEASWFAGQLVSLQNP